MGQVTVNLTLSALATPENRHTVQATADTGAMLSSLPPALAESLGLIHTRPAVARLADGSLQDVSIAEGVRFELEGRVTTDEALVMGDQVLIGQTVLEKTHLWVDCAGRRLVSDPEQPPYPMYRA